MRYESGVIGVARFGKCRICILWIWLLGSIVSDWLNLIANYSRRSLVIVCSLIFDVRWHHICVPHETLFWETDCASFQDSFWAVLGFLELPTLEILKSNLWWACNMCNTVFFCQYAHKPGSVWVLKFQILVIVGTLTGFKQILKLP